MNKYWTHTFKPVLQYLRSTFSSGKLNKRYLGFFYSVKYTMVNFSYRDNTFWKSCNKFYFRLCWIVRLLIASGFYRSIERNSPIWFLFFLACTLRPAVSRFVFKEFRIWKLSKNAKNSCFLLFSPVFFPESKHCIQFTMTLMAPAFIYVPFKHWLKSRYSKHSPDKLWWTMWVTFFILFSKKRKTYRFQY